jgi:hypothetical protein
LLSPLFDMVKIFLPNAFVWHPHQSGRVYNVLTSSQLQIHSDTEFKQRRDTAIDRYRPLRRTGCARHLLQDRAFARSYAV